MFYKLLYIYSVLIIGFAVLYYGYTWLIQGSYQFSADVFLMLPVLAFLLTLFNKVLRKSS